MEYKIYKYNDKDLIILYSENQTVETFNRLVNRVNELYINKEREANVIATIEDCEGQDVEVFNLYVN